MNTNTLAAAVAAARRSSPPPAALARSTACQPEPATYQADAAPTARPAARPLPSMADADVLMIAIQRSARTVDDIMTRRMLIRGQASGNR